MKQLRFQRWLGGVGNWWLELVLRSPLHRLVSRHTLLITVTGRSSGRQYTTPVNYVQHGDQLLILSQAKRTWWRNLRGGARVSIWLQGQQLHGRAICITDIGKVARSLRVLRRCSPLFQRALPIKAGNDELFGLIQLARGRVVVAVSELVPVINTHEIAWK